MIPSRQAFYGAVALQLAVLVLMVADRQWLLSQGREVKLELRPARDPRSLLSGHYVDLPYVIGELTVPAETGARFKGGDRAYVVLEEREGGVWDFGAIEPDRPGSGVFLRARVVGRQERAGAQVWLRLVYGFESFYVKEDEGGKWEARLRNGAVARVAVSGSGVAAFKGFVDLAP